ncbi:MAG: hypothetical protein H8E87_01210 [FCB group bacterium]|nr:hypothetical protein [FCB group bacterium]
MKVRYFIECRIDRQTAEKMPIGIWLQDSTGVDIYYPDETSDEYWEANEVLNRLAEAQLSPPPNFLDFHLTRGGYYVDRVGIFEAELGKFSADEFEKMTLQKAIQEVLQKM